MKIFRKWRSYIGFAAIGVFLPLVFWGISQGSEQYQQRFAQQFQGLFRIYGSVFNGFFSTHMAMNFLWVHVPFLITLVAGDVVAGEGAAGTFRLYLTRPVSRVAVLTSKLGATFIYTILLVIFFLIMSLGIGSLWLGTGDLVVFHEGIIVLPAGIAVGRFFLAFSFAAGVMLVVAAFCFMFSTMVNNSIGPIIGSMAVIIVGLAIANLPLDIFQAMKPYLFTSYFDIWQQAFYDPIPWDTIFDGMKVLTIYAVAFVGTSVLIFNRKDILT